MPSLTTDVLCIGLAGYDLIFAVPEYPREDSKYQINAPGTFSASGGGPAANAACLLSRWGLSCGLACVLGKDPWGARARAELEEAGTDLSLVETRPETSTPLSCVWVSRESGSRTIVNHRPPGAPLRLEASALRSRRQPKLLLMDGHEAEASLKAMEAWPRAVTVLDAGSRRRGTEILAAKVDYLAASAQFALEVTGVDDLEGAEAQDKCLRRLQKLAGGRVVVTLGHRGLIYLDKGGLRRLPAFPVRVVDTTAAGDVFHGAFAYCLVSGLPLAASLRFASAAAALSATRPGGRAAIPALKDVEDFLAKGEN
jgi:sulfofructose kinase